MCPEVGGELVSDRRRFLPVRLDRSDCPARRHQLVGDHTYEPFLLDDHDAGHRRRSGRFGRPQGRPGHHRTQHRPECHPGKHEVGDVLPGTGDRIEPGLRQTRPPNHPPVCRSDEGGLFVQHNHPEVATQGARSADLGEHLSSAGSGAAERLSRVGHRPAPERSGVVGAEVRVTLDETDVLEPGPELFCYERSEGRRVVLSDVDLAAEGSDRSGRRHVHPRTSTSRPPSQARHGRRPHADESRAEHGGVVAVLHRREVPGADRTRHGIDHCGRDRGQSGVLRWVGPARSGGAVHGSPDARVAPAPAQVRRQRGRNDVVVGIAIRVEQRCRPQRHRRSAVPALGHALFHHRGLYPVEVPVGAQALDGGNR